MLLTPGWFVLPCLTYEAALADARDNMLTGRCQCPHCSETSSCLLSADWKPQGYLISYELITAWKLEVEAEGKKAKVFWLWFLSYCCKIRCFSLVLPNSSVWIVNNHLWCLYFLGKICILGSAQVFFFFLFIPFVYFHCGKIYITYIILTISKCTFQCH